jgi:1-acyl-sn-glycerol-3-phosphate acyltransferase
MDRVSRGGALLAAARWLRFAAMLGTFWAGAGLFSLACWPLLLLPRAPRQRWARAGMMRGFRGYLALMHWSGEARFDLAALDAMRGAGPLVLAANHRSLLDAVLVVSRLPDIVCVAKPALWRHPCLGGALRAAGYLRADAPLQLVRDGVRTLAAGGQLLVFPEGRRGDGVVLGPLMGGFATIARHADVPVQTLVIESNSGFLGPGWPVLRAPDARLFYRVRLGERLRVESGRQQQGRAAVANSLAAALAAS